MNSFVIPGWKLAFLMLAAAIAMLPYAQLPAVQEAGATSAASGKLFSQQELDEILAPIALYPDALLAQVFMASTYPMEVVEAARWIKANPNLKGNELEDELQGQSWDPAVKSIAAVPQVLAMMDEKLDWTQKLGDAFLAQQKEVMDTVQELRGKAQEAGNLDTTPQQVVKTEEQSGQTVVIIESGEPETVYVPVYNPSTIYGTWWYSYPPPYYYYPPGYVARAGMWFAAGVIVGRAIWGNCNWRGSNIDIDINRYNNFNKVNLTNKSWNHNPEHRKGAAYRDQATASKYGRGSDRAAVQSREQFRGRAEQGRTELKGMDPAGLDKQVRAADRSSGDLGSRTGNVRGPSSRDLSSKSSRDTSISSRDLSSRTGSSSSSRGGGFSGVGSGASTRSASARGGASMGSRSMGGGRGGGRR